MIDTFLMIISVLIIIVVLLQSGRSAGVSSAFTGGNGGLNLFSNVKERGPEKYLSYATMGLGVLFLVLVIVKLITTN